MVCECWKWLSLPPPEVPEGTNRHYTNAEFETVMKRYFETQAEAQKKAKARMEQARKDAAANEAGPVQDGAVPTEIEFEKTVARLEEAKPEDASGSSASSE